MMETITNERAKGRIEFTPEEIETMLDLTLGKLKDMTEADPRNYSLLSALLKLSRAQLRLRVPLHH